MLVVICGDRNWTNREAIEREFMVHGLDPLKDTILHGGAKGADSIAGEIGLSHGFKVECVQANWGLYGRAAGPIRNKWMVDRGPDLVLAFHGDLENSKGTRDMVSRAKRFGIPTEVFSE